MSEIEQPPETILVELPDCAAGESGYVTGRTIFLNLDKYGEMCQHIMDKKLPLHRNVIYWWGEPPSSLTISALTLYNKMKQQY